MADEEGSGVVGTVLAMGLLYWFGYAVAIAYIAAVVAAAAAVIIAIGVLGFATISWTRLLGQARRAGDRAWLTDLWGAPILGLVAGGAVAASGIARDVATWDQSGGFDRLVRSWGPAAFYLGLPLAFVTFVFALFGTPTLLAGPRPRRLLAYVGFGFFGAYFTMVAYAYVPVLR